MRDNDPNGNDPRSTGHRDLRERAEGLRQAAEKARVEAKAHSERFRRQIAELNRQAAAIEAKVRARQTKQRRSDEHRVGRVIVLALAGLVATGDASSRDAAQRILKAADEADRLIAAELLGLAASPVMASESIG